MLIAAADPLTHSACVRERSRDLESSASAAAYTAGVEDALASQEQTNRGDDATPADRVQQENERNRHGNRRRERFLDDQQNQVRLEQQAALDLLRIPSDMFNELNISGGRTGV